MTTTAYPSRIDGWLRLVLGLPVVGAGVALAGGLASGQPGALLVGAGALLLYVGILFGLILPMRYELDDVGPRVCFGRVRLGVPWDRLLRAELSRNPLSSPALSLRRIRIAYQRPDGRETFVLISPPDRATFLAEIVVRRSRHELVDGAVLRKG